MVCMLVLVSSKAHSTARGLSAVTLLHSISRFSLEWERLSADGPLQNNKQGRSFTECWTKAFVGERSCAYPFLSYFLNAGKAVSGSSSCKEKGPELAQRHWLDLEQWPSTDVFKNQARIRHRIFSSFILSSDFCFYFSVSGKKSLQAWNHAKI